MLARLSFSNRLTLPDSILSNFPGVECFDVTEESGRIVLTPVRLTQADAVRHKLAGRGLSDNDVSDAVDWARRS